MCEKPTLARKPEQTDFDSFFTTIRPVLRDSDLVIGNLETVIAGEASGYTREMYSFNTPEIFLQALKRLPVHLVTTANNHALDRGKDGLVSTLAALERAGIESTGTQLGEPNVKIVHLGRVKIAVLAGTASINFGDHGYKLAEHDEHLLNLLAPQDLKVPSVNQPAAKILINKLLVRMLGQEGLMVVKKRLGRRHNVATRDVLLTDQLTEIEVYAAQMKRLIEEAKRQADLVFICPHMGGQFNPEPGSFAKWYMDYFVSCGADLIVANHPHVIQKMEFQKNTPLFYSLGNFSLSPQSTYIIPDHKPDIGLLLHAYVDEEDKRIAYLTLTPLIMKHDKLGFRVERLLSQHTEVDEKEQAIRWLEGRLNVHLESFTNDEWRIKARRDWNNECVQAKTCGDG